MTGSLPGEKDPKSHPMSQVPHVRFAEQAAHETLRTCWGPKKLNMRR